MELTQIIAVGCPGLSQGIDQSAWQLTEYKSLDRALKDETTRRVHAVVAAASELSTQSLSDAIRNMRRKWPQAEILIWSPRAGASFVREVLRAGARDVILAHSIQQVAPSIAALLHKPKISESLRLFRRQRPGLTRFEGILSRSRRMWDVFEQCVSIAETDATVLVMGETGTGKEMIARAIHRRSQRSGPFVPVNCASLPEHLVDSELFGHVKGAFTGASSAKVGLFKHAENGTLFLDEIGDMPIAAQFSLLRALQEHKIRPVGGHNEVEVNARVIAATSRPLDECVKNGTFREDLYYRLDRIRIIVPALRDRPEDILFLFSHFAKAFAKAYQLSVPHCHEDFIDSLIRHPWPGNVRQLENFTERTVLDPSPDRRTAHDFLRLIQPFSQASSQADNERWPTTAQDGAFACKLDRPLQENLRTAIEAIEKEYITKQLRACQGKMGKTAEAAGIHRRSLLRKIKKYRIKARMID